MSLLGARLGPYEITAKLGEGGMGQVWRAKDSQLGRDVALKLLPESFANDPERLARFEREAKLLAQLNHPNIAHIYGLETSGDTRALVMELVEGPTLAERLEFGDSHQIPPSASGSASARGRNLDDCHRIPLGETLSIALQIAQALEEAHEKGIVHRDLKPQNIKASMEGKVKVLDFGLAKAMEPAGGAPTASALAQSPTLTLGATVQGVILGTAAYMAPEQAAGGFVDRRADIWSFGVVLYEMLSGRRLFEGETVSHVLAGVLKDDPDFSALPAETPPRVRRLLARCLRKKPRERLQSIGDARLVLEEVIAGKDRDEAPSIFGAAAPAPVRRWIAWAAPGIALLLGGLGGLAAGRWPLAAHAVPSAPLRLELAVPEGLSIEWGEGQSSIALSADGRRLALAVVAEEKDRSGILVRDLDRHEPRLLAGTAGALGPFFSPDGEWIGYFTTGALYKVAATGGQPIRLASAAVTRRSRGAAWNKDGFIYFSGESDAAITRVADSGGPVEAVTKLDAGRGERTHRWPELTSDGKSLLFACDTTASPSFLDDARIEAMRLATGERHLLVDGASQARLLADDLLIYMKGGSVFALELDPERLAPRGKPVPFEQTVLGNLNSGAAQLAVSRLGTAAWIPGASLRLGETPVWLTVGDKSTPASIPANLNFSGLELSRDGRSAALSTGDATAPGDPTGRDIWVADLERQTVARLSFNENADSPTWTADGRRVAYRRVQRTTDAAGESQQIVWRPADGSGEATVLYEAKGVQFVAPDSFSPDDRYLAFVRVFENNADIWVLPLDPPGPPRPFQASPMVERGASVSPDGRWIAYLSRESGDEEVYVRPFPDGAGRWQVSTEGGVEPRWSADGRTLFFRTSGWRLMRVTIEAGAAFRASAPELFLTGVSSGPNLKTYGVAPDGKRVLALPFVRERKLHVVNYANDWLSRARQLLAREK